MRRLMERLPQSRQHEVTTHLDRAAAMGRDFIVLVVLNCTIATFGLILNSGAVIIGAMLIAPLMSPILALALALVRGDLARAGRALATLVVGTLLAVDLSAGLGWLVAGSQWNFLEQLPTEVPSRTQPTLFDLAVALAGGAAAAYALAQPGLTPTPRPTATTTPRPSATATPRPPATPRWTTTPRTATRPSRLAGGLPGFWELRPSSVRVALPWLGRHGRDKVSRAREAVSRAREIHQPRVNTRAYPLQAAAHQLQQARFNG
jgi:uncharacterized hydrophobic protein (TIGR00271 family)